MRQNHLSLLSTEDSNIILTCPTHHYIFQTWKTLDFASYVDFKNMFNDLVIYALNFKS